MSLTYRVYGTVNDYVLRSLKVNPRFARRAFASEVIHLICASGDIHDTMFIPRSFLSEICSLCSADLTGTAGQREKGHQFCGESCRCAGVLESSRRWPWWRQEAAERDKRGSGKRRQPTLTAVSFRDLLDDSPDEATALHCDSVPVSQEGVPTPHTLPPATSHVICDYLKSEAYTGKHYNTQKASESAQRSDWNLLDLITLSSTQQQVQHDKHEAPCAVPIEKSRPVSSFRKDSSLGFQYPWKKLASVNKRRISVNDVVATPQSCNIDIEDKSASASSLSLFPDKRKSHHCSLKVSDGQHKPRAAQQNFSQATSHKDNTVDVRVHKSDTSSCDLSRSLSLRKQIKRSSSPCELDESSASLPLAWSSSPSPAFSDRWIAATMVYYANMQYLAHCGTTHGVTLDEGVTYMVSGNTPTLDADAQANLAHATRVSPATVSVLPIPTLSRTRAHSYARIYARCLDPYLELRPHHRPLSRLIPYSYPDKHSPSALNNTLTLP
nr:uncharacterized protein LOC128698162 [Cherax quadricarinatus]